MVSCLSKNLHPSHIVREHFPNATMGHRVHDLTVVRLEEKRINRKQQLAVVVTHEDMVAISGTKLELYAAQRWFQVTKEGPIDLRFEAAPAEDSRVIEVEVPELPPQLLTMMERGNRVQDSDHAIMNGLVEVDDDNLPAPENVPDKKNMPGSIMKEWGAASVCPRLCTGAINMPPRLNWFPRDAKPDLVSLFLVLFPKDYLEDTLLVETNKELSKPVRLGEFLRWLGLWFLMGTTYCNNRREFWSATNISPYKGAPFRLNQIMSRNRFEEILSAIRLTSFAAPVYRDPFYEVRELMEKWNKNMERVFTPGWISCLDESMSKWVNKYSCPGFVVVPRKPWPYGNEYHSIACGVSGVMYAVELVEGRDEPSERPKKKFSELGKTVGLLLRLTKPLWSTSKVVVLDSGFCVLKGIVELRKKGVFASALIKKRRYWPKYVEGDKIAEHFQDKAVGFVDCWEGELDNTSFSIHCMKEPDYVMSLMTSYGTSQRFGDDQRRVTNGATTTIRYPEVIYNHFQYRDSVDNHNAARMFPISIEETWKTTRWPLRVLQFFLSITEVNVHRVRDYMFPQTDLPHESTTSQQDFRKEFANALIYNAKLDEEQQSPSSSVKRRRRNNDVHELVRLPPFRNFRGSRMIKTKTRCTQRKCLCGARRCNTYCKCNPGVFLCSSCFIDHISDTLSGEVTNY